MANSHRFVIAAAVAGLLGAAGCSNSGSPTTASGFPFGSSSGATILGSVAGMGGGDRSVTAAPGTLGVKVVGTDLAAIVSSSGRFQINGVPPGDVLLQFTDQNVNAAALIAGVSEGEEVEVEIDITGTTAAILSETRRAVKVQLCHRTGSGRYQLIDISVNAESAHRGHGDGAIGDPVPGDPDLRFDEACVPAVVPVTIEKTVNGLEADRAPGPSILVGDPVTWTYVVTNTGTAALSGIVVTDNDPAIVVDCLGVTSLAIGASMTCTAVGVAELGPYVNLGTVTALAGTLAATASDASHYLGVEPTDGPKVQLCHRTGNGSFHLISVGLPAEPAHLAHGDGKIGEAVPNQTGMIFGPSCSVMTGSAPPAGQ
jgi:hypothetical protein